MANLKEKEGKNTLEKIIKLLNQLAQKHNEYEVFYDFMELSALCIANKYDSIAGEKYEVREEQYRKTVSKYSPEEFKLITEAFAYLWNLLTDSVENEEYFDYLGKLYMEFGTNSKAKGQFFTPYNVSNLMANMSLDFDKIKAEIEKDPNYVMTVNECCVGSGGMVIAIMDQLNKNGINYAHNTFTICNDKDLRCVYMCYIQLSLLGIPAIVRHQDTITQEIYDEFHTPGYTLQYLRFRNKVKNL